MAPIKRTFIHSQNQPFTERINSAGQSSTTPLQTQSPLNVSNRPRRQCTPLNFKLKLEDEDSSEDSDDFSSSSSDSDNFSSDSEPSSDYENKNKSYRVKLKFRIKKPKVQGTDYHGFKIIPGDTKRKLYSAQLAKDADGKENIENSVLEDRRHKKPDVNENLNESVVNLAKKFLKL